MPLKMQLHFSCADIQVQLETRMTVCNCRRTTQIFTPDFNRSFVITDAHILIANRVGDTPTFAKRLWVPFTKKSPDYTPWINKIGLTR